MAIAPWIIKLIRKLKGGQTILGYVTQHKDKEGVPTMGGIIFVVSTFASCFIVWKGNKSIALTSLLVMLSYFLMGGLDDFIKIAFKRNLGLRAYQKIISQLAIAVLATIFAYKNFYIGSEINIPIAQITVDLKWWYIPFSIFVYIATTNSVNLTDGLDGLAGSTTSIYLAVFFVIIAISYSSACDMGNTFYAEELSNMLVFIAALIGSLTAFLWHNSHKARVFMGDTGSLALGGACASVALFSRNPFLILIVGIMFIVSSISVIVQVVSFKTRGKRVILMAPYHHHLEMSGYNESKIVAFYSIITAVAGIVSICIM
ncbi:MAG TPA: phospho-N-acetylmuramoyl-pentapeptide-transferase [Clostridia bacterium]|jgi:phospho-N-acetylmuramoyl-pentapeptide-transferase|nr:phospho-N-acetylmuramoyl-pentapeptide-transferase [Clostridia bacterium]